MKENPEQWHGRWLTRMDGNGNLRLPGGQPQCSSRIRSDRARDYCLSRNGWKLNLRKAPFQLLIVISEPAEQLGFLRVKFLIGQHPLRFQ